MSDIYQLALSKLREYRKSGMMSVSWQRRWMSKAAAAAVLIVLTVTVALPHLSGSYRAPTPLAQIPARWKGRERRWTELWRELPDKQWMRCAWWESQPPGALPAKSSGFLKVDCAGGLNQMRRDFCDGVGVAQLLNATLLIPQFEVSPYWNDTSGFSGVFDTNYFIKEMKGYIRVAKDLPPYLYSREPTVVPCLKKKNSLFDYTEAVLPTLLREKLVVLRPAASQRRDRYPYQAKAARCQACHQALRPVKKLRELADQLLMDMPRPFMALHLRFEPDMIAYSRCAYPKLSNLSRRAIAAARQGRTQLIGDQEVLWRNRGKCPLTPAETAFMLRSLGFPQSMPIYLAAGGGLLEKAGLSKVFNNLITKSGLLDKKLLLSLSGNSKAAIDYLVSLASDVYVATYFGNMDKMVVAGRLLEGRRQTLMLNRKAFALAMSGGYNPKDAAETIWQVHKQAVVTGRDLPLPDCFCECSAATGCSH